MGSGGGRVVATGKAQCASMRAYLHWRWRVRLMGGQRGGVKRSSQGLQIVLHTRLDVPVASPYRRGGQCRLAKEPNL